MSLWNRLGIFFARFARRKQAKVTVADLRAVMTETKPTSLVPDRYWRPIVQDWNKWSREH